MAREVATRKVRLVDAFQTACSFIMMECCMSVEANKECVRRHFEELWNAGQLDTIRDFFGKDFVNFGRQYEDRRDDFPASFTHLNRFVKT